MARHAPARGKDRRRILAAALSLGLLLPAVAVAAPAAADSAILDPLDQATEFNESLPVLDESDLQSLQGLDTQAPAATASKPASPGTASTAASAAASASAPESKATAAAKIPLAYRYVVIEDRLNVRKHAGAKHPKITSLRRNTKIVITGRNKSVSGATWREITVGKYRGWVHGGYIMKDFEKGNAKSALAKTGKLRKPTTRKGVTVLKTTWAAQPNGYWCGPASIKIALEAFGIKTTQAAMAKQAKTDREGTWLHQVARVMDYNAPAKVRYKVTTIRGQDAKHADRVRIRERVKRSIKAGVPVLVNIAATPDEQPPIQRQKTRGRFTLRHHMPIVGYNEKKNTVLVQDPWTKPFWIDLYRLADMAGTRGYASLR